MSIELLKVTAAKVTGPATLSLSFSDGRSGTADLSETINDAPVSTLGVLRDPELFSKLSLRYGVPTWSTEIDLAPEFLYFLCFRNDPGLAQQFADWGYLEPALS